MNEERRVLYALVAAAFHAVVAVLVVAGAATGLAPLTWTVVMGAVWTAVLVTGVLRWRRTGLLLALTIGSFLVWTVGTLIVT